MNNLSLFIYLAGVAGGAKLALILLSVAALLVVLVGGLIMVVDFKSKALIQWVWAPVIAIIVATLIPSKQTLYLIAGSEIGQQIIQTQEAREIYEDIRAVIRSYAVEGAQ